VEAHPHVVVVRPLAIHDEGQIEVFTDGQRATGWFRIERPSGPGSATALASGAAP
jgi:hypothetical protein